MAIVNIRGAALVKILSENASLKVENAALKKALRAAEAEKRQQSRENEEFMDLSQKGIEKTMREYTALTKAWGKVNKDEFSSSAKENDISRRHFLKTAMTNHEALFSVRKTIHLLRKLKKVGFKTTPHEKVIIRVGAGNYGTLRENLITAFTKVANNLFRDADVITRLIDWWTTNIDSIIGRYASKNIWNVIMSDLGLGEDGNYYELGEGEENFIGNLTQNFGMPYSVYQPEVVTR